MEIGGQPFDDLNLAEMLDQIVTKYDYGVEEFLAVRYMIDSQFEVTKGFIKKQAFIYIGFFFIPLLLQIFVFDDYPEMVLYCNHSCLFVSVLFLGVEFIQLDENGAWEYVTDRANQIDMTTLLTFFYYYINRFYD